MASLRISARGSVASISSQSSMRKSTKAVGNWIPQPFFNFGASVTVATSTQRQPIPLRDHKESNASVANCTRRTKFIASLLTTAAMVSTCQAENQAVQNKQKVVSKAPSGSKEKAYTPNLDDGGIGGGPGGGDGGGGGGGGGFLFWGLLMLLEFIRDNEQDKPYRGRKPNKKALANKAKRRPQLQA